MNYLSKKYNHLQDKKWILLAILSCLIFVVLTTAFITKAMAENSNKYGTAGIDYVAGQAIVCVNGDTDTLNSLTQRCCNNANANVYETEELMTLQGSAQLQTAVANQDQASITNLSLSESDNIVKGNVDRNTKSPHIILVNCCNTEDFLSAISGQDEILWAQPNYIRYADNESCAEEKTNNVKTMQSDNSQYNEAATEYTTINQSKLSNSSPNDTYLDYQWSLDATSYGGDSAFDIDYKTDYPYNDAEESVIAVLDSGVAYDHPDINMWDEGLNYPTLVAMGGGQYGFNANQTDPSGQPTSDPYDYVNGHGTHCASNIGAITNNSAGTAGVDNHTKIMACRFMGDSGSGSDSYALKCFNYIIAAKQAGVKVYAINNSWGTNPSDLKQFALEAAIVEAGMNGIITTFTSGNEGVSLEGYPNKTYHNPYVIIVGASDSSGYRGDFSNYGANMVHVFAPGTMILAGANKAMGQYLPWLQKTDDSYFYEDFESESSPKVSMSVTATPVGGEPQTITATKINLGDTTTYKNVFQATMDQIEYGQTFDMEATIEIPKEQVKTMDINPYVAMMTSCKNMKTNSALAIGFYNSEGQWIQKEYCNIYDSNMNVVSSLSDDSLYTEGDTIKIGLKSQFVSTSKTSKPQFWIDNLGLGKKACLYAYEDGTSMACPVVTGIAGMVAATTGRHENAEDVLWNEAIIKGSTSHHTALEGLCQSEGVVNLHRAYSAAKSKNPEQVLDPVMQNLSFSDDGKTGILSGYFFGDILGSGGLQVDGTQVSIKSWSNTSITFDVPDSKEHLAKFVLTNSYGKSATRHFEINKGSTKGFVDLPVSDITHDLNGQQIKAKDLYPMKSASTQNSFYQLSSLKNPNCTYLERYDYASGQWFDVDLSPFNIDAELNMYAFSLTAGKDEVYFLYAEKDTLSQTENGNDTTANNRFYLATYSETKNQWIYKVDVSDYCVLGSMIGVYNNELILCGYDVMKGLKDTIEVFKIYPDTGRVYGQITSIPSGKDGVVGAVSGNISTYDNNIVITDTLSTSDSDKLVEYKRYDYAFTNGPIFFDGQNWHKGDSALYKPHASQTLVDPSQNFYNIGAACVDNDETLCNIIVGPVKNNSTSNMIDTWIYNSALDSSVNPDTTNDNPWIPLNDVRFNSFKNAKVSGVIHDGHFYVMGMRGDNLDTRFRSLDLSLVGLHSKDVSSNALHEYVDPVSPDDNTDSVANTAATSDNAGIILAIVLLLLVLSTLCAWHVADSMSLKDYMFFYRM